MYDILIRGAQVIDGTGKEAYLADVAVKDGKLVMNPKDEAAQVIDATGLALCPGFIDVHSHGDSILGTEAGRLCKTSQGVTTELAGLCGTTYYPFSTDPEKRDMLLKKLGHDIPDTQERTSLEGYLRSVNALPKTANIGLYIGHGSVRISAMGFALRTPTAEELEAMKGMVREAMEHGAMGMSSGLIYAPSCYADENELVALCKVVAEYGGTYATHMRSEADDVVESVREAIRVAERAGCKLNISHHKIAGRANWGRSVQTLELIHEARARGVDITLDAYPYTASSTGLNACMPSDFFSHGPEKMYQLLADPAVRAELKPRMSSKNSRLSHCGGWGGILVTVAPKTPAAVNKTLLDYAAEINADPFDAYFDLMHTNGGAAKAIYFTMSEEDLQRIVCDENTVIGSDGVVRSLTVPSHPRGFGTFTKAIRYFVREKGLLTLEQMIHKMTGLPARRFGLATKGIIADGMDADLVLFRPDEIRDNATYKNGLAQSEGIERVIVAGETVFQDNKLTGACPGVFLPRRS